MDEDMDINCGEILDGTINVHELGLSILKQILATASGELTKSEEFSFGDFEFAPWIIGAVMQFRVSSNTYTTGNRLLFFSKYT